MVSERDSTAGPRGHPGPSPGIGPLPLLLSPRPVAVALLVVFIAAGTLAAWCWICLGLPDGYFETFATRPLDTFRGALEASRRWGALTRAFAWTGMLVLVWMMTAPLRGLLARWAVLRRHRREEIEFAGALDFVRDWLRSLVWCWPVIILVGWFLVALAALFGLLGRFPFPWGIGDLIVAVLFLPALIFAMLATFVGGGGLAASPLLLPALSVEGTDLFDADSRGLSYVYARPWTYLWGEVQTLFRAAIPAIVAWYGRDWADREGVLPADHPAWLAVLALVLALGLLETTRGNLGLYLHLRELVDKTPPDEWNAELRSRRRPHPESTHADAVAVPESEASPLRAHTRRFEAGVRLGTNRDDPSAPLETRNFTETWRDLWMAFRISLDLTKLTLVFLAAGTSAVLIASMMLHFQMYYGVGNWNDVLDLGPRGASAIVVAALHGLQSNPLVSGAVLAGGMLAMAAVWGLVGGVVSRAVMVEVAWDRRLPTRAAIRFAAERWGSFTLTAIPGAIGVLASLAGLGLLPLALGLPQGREYSKGEIPQALAILLPFIGIGSLIVSLQASAAIAAERCGGFAALLRAVRHLFFQLPELAAYQCCAFGHGLLCSLYVGGFSLAAAGIALFAVAGGMGEAGSRLLGYVFGGGPESAPTPLVHAAHVIVAAWLTGFLGLAASFPLAYLCVSQSVQYLLCRKALDREPMSAVVPDGLPGAMAGASGAAMFQRFTRKT